MTTRIIKSLKSASISAATLYLTKQWAQNPDCTFVWVVADSDEAYRLWQNATFFASPEVAGRLVFFPLQDGLPYSGIANQSDTTAVTLQLLDRLSHKESLVIITTFANLLRPLIPKNILTKNRRLIGIGNTIDRDSFCEWLVELGYSDSILVEEKGTFAVRGNILDLYPPSYDQPVRIELEGDTLASLRHFDPVTQLSERALEEVMVLPAREILLTEETVETAIRHLKSAAQQKDLPGSRQREFAEHLRARRFFTGIDTFLPYFYEERVFLHDYLPKETTWILQDTFHIGQQDHARKEELKRLYQGTQSLEQLIPPEKVEQTWHAWMERADQKTIVYMGGDAGDTETITLQTELIFKQPNIEAWCRKIKEWHRAGYKQIFVCQNELQAQRLKEILEWHEVATTISQSTFAESRQATHKIPQIIVGDLTNGFLWHDRHLLVLTENELFGQKHRRFSRKSKKGAFIPHLTDMAQGDLVVHEEHGVARYLGLKHMTIGVDAGDYLMLEFLGADKLYLPVYRMNVLTRYIGSGEEAPPLDRMGGSRWKNARKKAHQSVYKIAQELLKVHALRAIQKGLTFDPATKLEEEFAAAFPYEETPDQEKAIRDVLQDMEQPKPMDRLICGDVGYGKTEVAMRAAFKAVASGYQVAVLVPTTVLALQHFENFLERFKNSAVAVAMLSRFATTQEQKEIKKGLAQGSTDIVVGTHALFSERLKFKRLGLLVVDEEHRFGVRHKERIKKMKANIDVMTLSATPIPRTLHMSLTGLKDLSLIETPPVDRLAIRTHIVQTDDAIIHHAISKELERGGQTFFVHNRIATIELIHRRLSKLFPQATIGVAHGQMEETDLEKVMIDFLHQRIQILLTTAIIESGIDVQNANTMLIHRADTFGLAQLYQLRGRVGRSDRQAYCYLLIPDRELMTKEASRRLTVLARYTELGSGFQIASHDLEIRGAGNLLGTAQSGFIEEIGYELYTKLLARTIRKLKGEVVLEDIEPEIKIPTPAFIPEEYLPDPTLRMGLYKRLANLEKEEDLPAIESELKDRFGPLPGSVSALLEIIRLKLLAQTLRITQIHYKKPHFALTFHSTTPLTPQILIDLVQKNPAAFQLKPPSTLFFRPSIDAITPPLSIAKNLLTELRHCT